MSGLSDLQAAQDCSAKIREHDQYILSKSRPGQAKPAGKPVASSVYASTEAIHCTLPLAIVTNSLKPTLCVYLVAGALDTPANLHGF